MLTCENGHTAAAVGKRSFLDDGLARLRRFQREVCDPHRVPAEEASRPTDDHIVERSLKELSSMSPIVRRWGPLQAAAK